MLLHETHVRQILIVPENCFAILHQAFGLSLNDSTILCNIIKFKIQRNDNKDVISVLYLF